MTTRRRNAGDLSPRRRPFCRPPRWRVAGFHGMIGLSIVAAAVVLVCACALAPAPPADWRWLVAPWASAARLWFYAVSGWEHAPAVAFGTAAFAWAMRASPATLAARARATGARGALTWRWRRASRRSGAARYPGLLLLIWMPRPLTGASLRWMLAGCRCCRSHCRRRSKCGGSTARPRRTCATPSTCCRAALHLTDAPNLDVPVLRAVHAAPALRDGRARTGCSATARDTTDPGVHARAARRAASSAGGWRSSVGLLLWLLAFGANGAGRSVRGRDGPQVAGRAGPRVTRRRMCAVSVCCPATAVERARRASTICSPPWCWRRRPPTW